MDKGGEMKELNEADLQRFESKIMPAVDGCWYWLGATNPDGYGSFSFKSKMTGAHRASYMIYKGEIPKGLFVIHSCDNPACVNPDHLRVGTPHDNNMDQVARNRTTYGERCSTAKFTTIQIQAILDAYAAGHKQCDICRYFKRGDSIINLIVKRKIWKRVQN
jgi:hypothetical protein